jgi:hypothetical protein
VVDPLAEKYYSVSPFVYCGNNPINRIDPTGMKWEDTEEAERLKNRVAEKKQSLELDLAEKQSKLESKGLSAKRTKRIEKQIAEYKERISYLEKSLADIDLLGKDENNTYAFNHISGGRHQVRQGDDGIIYIDTSSDAMSIHEIAHVRQSLKNGGLQFSDEGLLHNVGIFAPTRDMAKMVSEMEIEAYRIQYSYDRTFPENSNSLQGIDVHSVGGIVDTNGKHVYEVIHKYSDFLQKRSKLQK